MHIADGWLVSAWQDIATLSRYGVVIEKSSLEPVRWAEKWSPIFGRWGCCVLELSIQLATGGREWSHCNGNRSAICVFGRRKNQTFFARVPRSLKVKYIHRSR